MVEKSPAGVKGAAQLKAYWLTGAGAPKWIPTDTPWTNLYQHLLKYMNTEKAKETASRWFIEVFHFAAGSDQNRVLHGHQPRGHKVGPG